MSTRRRKQELKPVALKKRDITALNDTANYCIKLLESQHMDSDIETTTTAVLALANNYLALYNAAIYGQVPYIAGSNSIH